MTSPAQTAKVDRLLVKIEHQEERLQRIRKLLLKKYKGNSVPETEETRNSYRITVRLVARVVVALALIWSLTGSYLTLCRITGADQHDYIPTSYSDTEAASPCSLFQWLNAGNWYPAPKTRTHGGNELYVRINATDVLHSPVCWYPLNRTVPDVIVAMANLDYMCTWNIVQGSLSLLGIVVILIHEVSDIRELFAKKPSNKTITPNEDEGDRYVSSTMKTITRELHTLLESSDIGPEKLSDVTSSDDLPTSRVQRRLQDEFERSSS